jgi:hypothetical protein
MLVWGRRPSCLVKLDEICIDYARSREGYRIEFRRTMQRIQSEICRIIESRTLTEELTDLIRRRNRSSKKEINLALEIIAIGSD